MNPKEEAQATARDVSKLVEWLKTFKRSLPKYFHQEQTGLLFNLVDEKKKKRERMKQTILEQDLNLISEILRFY